MNISIPRGTGPLFTNKKGDSISVFILSRLIVKLILKGDPQNKPKVHDIRKYASSLSFMNSMDIKDLLHSMHWKSSAAFYRHYMFATNNPSQAVAVPGRILPQTEENEMRSNCETVSNCDENQIYIDDTEVSDTPSSEYSAEF